MSLSVRVGMAIARERNLIKADQKWLAAHTGISQPTISRIERGVQTISIEQLYKIADCFCKKASYFVLIAENIQNEQTPKTIAERVGARIRSERLRLSITQSELAHNVGMKRVQISKFECGNQEPTISDLQKICEFFKKTILDFISLDNSGEHQ